MDKANNRRGQVTPENRREAMALKKLYDERLELRARNGAATQADFGHLYDIGNQSAVGFFLSGATALSLKAARGFAIGLGVQIDAFSPRLAALAAELGALARSGPLGIVPSAPEGGLSDRHDTVAAVRKSREVKTERRKGRK